MVRSARSRFAKKSGRPARLRAVVIPIRRTLSLQTYEKTMADIPSRGMLPRGAWQVVERRSLE
jgi:hypothetical protein